MSTTYDRTLTGQYTELDPVLQSGEFAPTRVDVNGRLLVDATVTANFSAAQEVMISDADDSIKIGDGSGKFLKINSDGSITANTSGELTGNVDATIQGLNSFKTSQYAIGTSEVQITSSPLSNRSSISLKVISSDQNPVFFCQSSGSVLTQGYPLYNGDSVQMDLTESGTIFAQSASSNQMLYVLEIA